MGLGVPLRKASGSRFPLQVLAGLPAVGFPLQSLTRNARSEMERRDRFRVSPFKSNPALYPLSYTPGTVST